MVNKLGISLDDQIKKMVKEYNFSEELIKRYGFFYGMARTTKIIEALKTHPEYYPIRVNTLLTTPDELLQSLEEKDIIVKKHPVIEEALLIKVEGPNNIQQKEKTVAVHKAAADRVLIGGNVGASSIQQKKNLNIGEEVSITDKFGSIVGNGILMMDSNEISSQKRGVAIRITESIYRLPNFQNLKEFLRGQFIPQDFPSILVGAQIKNKPKDRLLDMNVGEGKILTHIWQNNSKIDTRIIALEDSGSKIQKLKENMKRLRMIKAPFEITKMTLNQFQRKFTRDETFNTIIVSPKNSETGARPKVSDTTNEHHILKAAKIQKEYIKQAARLIKPNGTIFYSTNSLDPEENEYIIKYAVENLKLTVQKQEYNLGDKCSGDLEGADYLQYFFPEKHDTPGYFIAKLTK